MIQPLTSSQLKILEDFERSGLVTRDYCKQNGLELYKLEYIIHKDQKIKAESKSSPNLVKVQSFTTKTSNLKLVIKDITLFIESDFDEDILIKVIKVLRT